MNEPPIKVLLVAVSEADFLQLREWLQPAGPGRYLVERAANHDSALDALGENGFAAAIVGFEPGGPSASDFFQLAKARGCTAPVIALLPEDTDPSDVSAVHAGAADALIRGRIHAGALDRSVRHALERKRQETDSRQFQQRCQSIVESALFGIFQLGPNGHLTVANSALARTLGYPSAKELLRHPHALGRRSFARPERWDEFERALRSQGIVLDFEHETCRQDGAVVWVTRNTYAICDPSGKLIRFDGTLELIGERKHRQEQLLRDQKMNSLSQVAADIAHAYSNRLCVIQGHAALLETTQDLPAGMAESLGQIAQEAARAAHLTRQLLTFARRSEVAPQPLDVEALIRGCSGTLRQALEPSIKLQIHSSMNLPRAWTDPAMLEQALVNICLNARDAMPMGGALIIHTSVAVIDAAFAERNPELDAGTFVCVRLSDTGGGISAENLPHIFEPFFSTKPSARITGLGLATAYGIVKQHGGALTVTSEVGRGTTFLLFLRACESAPAIAEHRAVSRAPAGKVILAAEDDGAMLRLIQRILHRNGREVLAAPGSAAALELWHEHKHKIGLLLTDLVMPDGASGRELAEKLLEEQPALRVIYMSGYGLDVIGQGLALEEGRNYLQKPFRMEALVKAVADALDEQP